MRTTNKKKSTDGNRKSPIQVKFRMTETENQEFEELLKSSGMSAQDFLIH